MSESIWSDVGGRWVFFFLFVTLSPGCILNVAKFLSTVKFVVLSWGSLAIAVLCSLSAMAAAEWVLLGWCFMGQLGRLIHEYGVL